MCNQKEYRGGYQSSSRTLQVAVASIDCCRRWWRLNVMGQSMQTQFANGRRKHSPPGPLLINSTLFCLGTSELSGFRRLAKLSLSSKHPLHREHWIARFFAIISTLLRRDNAIRDDCTLSFLQSAQTTTKALPLA